MATALAAALVGCTAGNGCGGGASKTNCANDIEVKDVPVVTCWGWLPDTEQTVAHFQEKR